MALTFWGTVAVAGPSILAAMGGFVSMIPNLARRVERRYWFAGFILIGALTTYAVYVEGALLQRQVTGGEVITLTVDGERDQSGNYILSSLNGNDVPVFDVFINVRPNADAPIRSQADHDAVRWFQYELGTIPVGLKLLRVALPPGYYQIMIHTRDQEYVEMLRFAPLEKGMGQSYIVADFWGHKFAQITTPETFPKVY